jgi:hypothetical protein
LLECLGLESAMRRFRRRVHHRQTHTHMVGLDYGVA